MLKIIIFIIALLLMIGVPLTAAAGQEYRLCMSKHESNAGWASCYYKSVEKWNLELNKEYFGLMKKLPSKYGKYLKKSEISWMLYRRYNCDADGQMMYGGGALEGLEIGACLRSMLIDRVRWLKKLSDNVEGAADSKTVEYFNNNQIMGDTGNGKNFPIGNLQICAKVNKRFKYVNVQVEFSWTGHLLDTGKVPFKKKSEGDIYFRFIDGWGNTGDGSIARRSNGYILSLKPVKINKLYGSNDLDEYGTYNLKEGRCKKY
ncbi:MAG: DUF1311 domain-containing protein [Candidatus Acidulodesulfobacterium ferriphilum]|uniref:DUF1311 domain-containing protein n=1 Tax=Candidatus Acidulodesulfobacterium ferriphilum TaxID=2597223 RepID=A0A519BBC0_9DELT|nr:MAG: DUF1311 domain-containing protein [Candidatus Acidulodesulfobacterium ferriphilum]